MVFRQCTGHMSRMNKRTTNMVSKQPILAIKHVHKGVHAVKNTQKTNTLLDISSHFLGGARQQMFTGKPL